MQKLLIRNISVLKLSEAQHRAHNSPHLKVVSFSIRETVREGKNLDGLQVKQHYVHIL